MKRWLLILLVVLLPLQLAWAGVADYCGDAHQHADAHALHQHAAEADASDDGAELDCGHCHGHSTPLASSSAPTRLPLAGLETPVALPVCGAPPPSARPERPQWSRLA